MRSIKVYMTLLALLTSLSAFGDRGRDRGHHDSHKPLTQSSRHQHSSRKNGYGQAHHSYKKHHKKKGHQPRHGQGFSGDYRHNPNFDNRRYDHGYSKYPQGYRDYPGYKAKKHYKKWRKNAWKHHKKWYKKQHHFYHYQPYADDWYRYQPLRGLGHYFHRSGYGYGHWHEGMWCPDYHSEAWFRNYYSHYPYRDGWRFGDGDFGIWFSF
ncbi:hypothetical protein ACFODZ_12495 [Marinicella sediminis]|uniref:Uncharacterized protein n=1 Tax=Marinicella sediminis TaxID=1792834 RepID=A0ABV7JAC0_9GAMM|nr:hypothetical protein [Marinicella sediminis]